MSAICVDVRGHFVLRHAAAKDETSGNADPPDP